MTPGTSPFRRGALAGLAALAVVGGLGLPAQAQESNEPAQTSAATDAAAVAGAIDDAVPALLDGSTTRSSSDSDSAMTAEGAGSRVDVPRESSDPVVITPVDATSIPLHVSSRDLVVDDPQAAAAAPPAGMSEPAPAQGEPQIEAEPAEQPAPTKAPPVEQRTIEVTVPGAEDAAAPVQVEPGVTVFAGTDSDASQAVQSSADGATRFLTVIDGPDAPTSYRFALGLAPGVTLEPQDDGSVVVTAPEADGKRLPISRVAAPWGVDADQRQVPVRFAVDGDDLVLHVAHADAAYPVTADPELFFFHYFSPASPRAEGGSLYGSSVGRFTSQVNYSNMQRLSMQWSFQLSYAQRSACSYHQVQEFARAAVNGRQTRYSDNHAVGCDYTFHSSMSSYTYADDRLFPTKHYLRGYMGMKLSLWVSLQFPTGPRSVRQIHVYADYVL